MKAIYLVLILFAGSFAYAQGARDEFNQNSAAQNHRAQVEAIASEQGIDLSTEEGRHTLAQYLHKTGQQNLLPPRRGSRGSQQNAMQGNQPQAGEGFQGPPRGGENCHKPKGAHQRQGGPSPTDSY